MLEAVHLSSLCLDLIKPPTVHLWRLNRGTPNDPYYGISHSDWSKPVDQLAGQWRIVLHYFIQQVGDQLSLLLNSERISKVCTVKDPNGPIPPLVPALLLATIAA